MGVEGELLLPVQLEGLVAQLLVIGADAAGAQAQGGAGQVQVLPHVAHVRHNHPVGVDAVAPLAAVGHKAPVEHHVAFGRPALAAQALLHQGEQRLLVLHGGEQLQLVGHGQVVIGPGQQALHLAHQQVGLKGVPGPAAGGGADGGVALATDGLDALGGPQQKGELQQAHVLLGVDAAALALCQQLVQVVLQGQALKIPGQVDAVLCHGGLYQGGLGLFQLLVGFVVAAVPLQFRGVLGL